MEASALLDFKSYQEAEDNVVLKQGVINISSAQNEEDRKKINIYSQLIFNKS